MSLLAPQLSSKIPGDRMALLFMVMLVSAAGNTAMQSTLPAIASQLDVADWWVSLAFSWSAILWVLTAPYWARMSDRRGRKLLMAVGLWGFIASMGLCGLALWLGLNGVLGAAATFILFALFRTLYGGFGSAAPPAVQAYVAARTDAEDRTKALSLLASSFGMGTVIGPAVAHFMVFWPFGLAGPLIMFAIVGVVTLVALRLRLPNDTPRYDAKGIVTAYPSAASAVALPAAVEAAEGEMEDAGIAPPAPVPPLAWTDRRIIAWLGSGLIGGHAQAILLGVIGFLVRDRMGLQDNPGEAVQAIGNVMLFGAMATLLAQWGFIPLFSPSPAVSVICGTLAALLGVALIALSEDFYGMSTGFALASLGFGLFRPGFTAGASLAVGRAQQGDVAGKIAAINGAAYIIAPAAGVALYNWWEPAVFILTGGALAVMIAWGALSFRRLLA